jgi:outer membrane immunogenic protein
VDGFYVGGALGWIGTNPKIHYWDGCAWGAFRRLVCVQQERPEHGLLSGYNYQMGQLVLGVEGDFTSWTVGKIQYTAITANPDKKVIEAIDLVFKAYRAEKGIKMKQ